MPVPIVLPLIEVTGVTSRLVLVTKASSAVGANSGVKAFSTTVSPRFRYTFFKQDGAGWCLLKSDCWSDGPDDAVFNDKEVGAGAFGDQIGILAELNCFANIFFVGFLFGQYIAEQIQRLYITARPADILYPDGGNAVFLPIGMKSGRADCHAQMRMWGFIREKVLTRSSCPGDLKINDTLCDAAFTDQIFMDSDQFIICMNRYLQGAQQSYTALQMALKGKTVAVIYHRCFIDAITKLVTAILQTNFASVRLINSPSKKPSSFIILPPKQIIL